MSEESAAKAEASEDKPKGGDEKPAAKSEDKPAAESEAKTEAKAEKAEKVDAKDDKADAKAEKGTKAEKAEKAEKAAAKSEEKSAPKTEERAEHKELAQQLKTAAYGSVALGAVLIGVSLETIGRGLVATSVSLVAPGVFSLLVAILLFRTAGAVEAVATESDAAEREKKLVSAFTAMAVDKVRYVALTLALGSIAFLLVNFR